MNKNLTHIEVVLDRSGSMCTIRSDMEGGFKTFLDEQKDVEGTATMTLTQFDTVSETVIDGANIKDIEGLTLVPRGGTALYDCLGSRIIACGKKLADMPEANRPGLVVFVIITDGEENASREFTAAQIKSMIDEQEEKYGWCFVYLGADQDSMRAGSAFGIKNGATLDYDKSSLGVNAMYSTASKGIGKARRCAIGGQSVTSSSILQEDPITSN